MVGISNPYGVNTQSTEPLFSVIVPFLNEQRWLPFCLQALQNQSFDSSRFELIFVDNGSTDDSMAILGNHPQLSVFHESRRDPYLARNRAIQSARGTYLVFLDADCIADPDWLTRLSEAVHGSGPAIILGSIGYPASASILLRSYRDYYDQKLEHMLRRKLKKNYFGHAGNMAIHTNVFRKLGPFLPMPIVGDTEILHRLTEKLPEAQIVYCHNARVVHAEVTSFRICLKKVFESGQYTRALSQMGGCQPFSHRDRLQIFKACVQLHKYGLASTLAMVATLTLGLIAFEAGRLWRPKRKPSEASSGN